MTNDEIVAATETAYELVASYSKDLMDFLRSLGDESAAVQSSLSTMHNYWEGSLYDEFAKNLRGKLTRIAAELQRGDNLRQILDSSAVELKEAIEILQAAGEGLR